MMMVMYNYDIFCSYLLYYFLRFNFILFLLNIGWICLGINWLLDENFRWIWLGETLENEPDT